MSTITSTAGPADPINLARFFLTRIGIMVGSALILSAAVIIYFDSYGAPAVSVGVQNEMTLAAQTLFPYMISAVVAAITAIGVIAILPMARRVTPTSVVQERLHRLADGDLASPVNVTKLDMQMKGIAHELNRSIGHLGKSFAELKVINRQQWDYLESIRVSLERGEINSAMTALQIMEKNWQRIAEIEQRMETN